MRSAVSARMYSSVSVSRACTYSTRHPHNNCLFVRPCVLCLRLTALRGDVDHAAMETSVRSLTSNSRGAVDYGSVVRITASQAEDQVVCSVIMGVLWDRLNDARGRNWRHGVLAIDLMMRLVDAGCAYCFHLARSWSALLRYYIREDRPRAAQASAVSRSMTAWPATQAMAESAVRAGRTRTSASARLAASATAVRSRATHPGASGGSLSHQKGAVLLQYWCGCALTLLGRRDVRARRSRAHTEHLAQRAAAPRSERVRLGSEEVRSSFRALHAAMSPAAGMPPLRGSGGLAHASSSASAFDGWAPLDGAQPQARVGLGLSGGSGAAWPDADSF